MTVQVAKMKKRRLSPFDITFDSSELAVREALAAVLDNLQPLNLTSEELSAVELVLAEVLNNVVEHAYADSKKARNTVCVQGRQQADGLHIDIRDRGAPMPHGQLPVGTLASKDVDFEDVPEGGFGWFLIQHLAKDVVYTRKRDENLLSLRLAVGLEQSGRF